MTRLLLVGLAEPQRSGLLDAAVRAGFDPLACDLDAAEGTFCLNHRAIVLLDPSAAGGAAVAVAMRHDHPAVLMIGLAGAAPIEARLSWLDALDRCLPIDEDPWVVLAEVRALTRLRKGWDKARGANLASTAELRRLALTPRQADRLTSGPVSLEVTTLTGGVEEFSATVGPVSFELSPQEGEMLRLLLQKAGTVLPKAVIYSAFYGDRLMSRKIIDVVICKIRRKLSIAGAPHDFIRTVWGRGYSIGEAPAAERSLAA